MKRSMDTTGDRDTLVLADGAVLPATVTAGGCVGHPAHRGRGDRPAGAGHRDRAAGGRRGHRPDLVDSDGHLGGGRPGRGSAAGNAGRDLLWLKGKGQRRRRLRPDYSARYGALQRRSRPAGTSNRDQPGTGLLLGVGAELMSTSSTPLDLGLQLRSADPTAPLAGAGVRWKLLDISQRGSRRYRDVLVL